MQSFINELVEEDQQQHQEKKSDVNAKSEHDKKFKYKAMLHMVSILIIEYGEHFILDVATTEETF